MIPNTKLCTGPGHLAPTQLPITTEYWYFHKSGPKVGQPSSRCRVCTNWRRFRNPAPENHGWLLWAPIEPLLRELMLRCDGNAAEVARRMGTNRQTVYGLLKGRQRVQKKTVARIVTALRQTRTHDRRRNGTSPTMSADAYRLSRIERGDDV